jgi:hypothetical protein
MTFEPEAPLLLSLKPELRRLVMEARVASALSAAPRGILKA